jgi:hypothetical protein
LVLLLLLLLLMLLLLSWRMVGPAGFLDTPGAASQGRGLFLDAGRFLDLLDLT